MPVTTTRHDDVLVIEIDNPPVNALSPAVMEALIGAIDAAVAAPEILAVVIRGAGRLFMGGADITALREAAWGNEAAIPDAHDVLHHIEHAPKPVVMAIHGSALGGGLELAMAGHFRIATENAELGQPEVNLGLIPGFEGTARLPRLVGLAKALDMCVSGRSISAPDALDHDLLSAVTNGDLTGAAITLARVAAARGARPRTSENIRGWRDAPAHRHLLLDARALARESRPHETAPERVIDAIEAGVTQPFDEACRRERVLFAEALRDEQSKALIHLFFAERALAKSGKPIEATIATLAAATLEERQRLREDGVSDAEIDRALRTFGMTLPGAAEEFPPSAAISPLHIVERWIHAIDAAAAQALDADPGLCEADIDAITVTHLHFPRWRGGAWFYATRTGYVRSRG